MGHRRRVFRSAFIACAVAHAVALSGCASSDVADEDTERPGKRHSRKSEKRQKVDSDDNGDKGDGGGKVGAPMPSIVVRQIDGRRKIDLGALKGKVVLVDIWASWCGPCMEEMPLLDAMAARLKSKGVEIIAVSVDEDKASAQQFLSSRPSWSLTVAHDPKGKLPEALQPSKMPSSYVMDSEGIIRYVNEGFERKDIKVLEKRLVALAAEDS
jgi:thiol-disulfide isomerase/thioredoxin